MINQMGMDNPSMKDQFMNQVKRIRNKNPNCNHNSSSTFYTPHYSNVKYDETTAKDTQNYSTKPDDRLGNAFGQAGALIMNQQKTGLNLFQSMKDPQKMLYILDYCLAESMYIKDLQAAVAEGQGGRLLANLLQMLVQLELIGTQPAHKAFMLALIRSSKINVENLNKTLLELRAAGNKIDTDCIYCKYSLFALKESGKVGLLQHQQQQQANDPNT